MDEQKFDKLKQEYKSLQAELARPDAYSQKDFADKSKRFNELESVIALLEKRTKLIKDRTESEQLLQTEPDMAELARAEITKLDERLKIVNADLEDALLPKDPNDNKNVIVEIRAGAGGDEASLFAGDLYRMYIRYGERHGFKTELVSQSPSEVGGYKEIIFKVSGEAPYSLFKFESGVHRVQRVPVTESSGRIHTSTATVAVMPEAEEQDVAIDEQDLRIDVFRSSGHGGQSVNTTDSAVRVTHEPTGMVVSCQDEKSQIKNKQKALGVLRSRLLAKQIEEAQQAEATKRRQLIGSGDRSEKIRTYNFPQDRITDHRINFSRSDLPGALDGGIDDLIQSLQNEEKAIVRRDA